MPKDVQSHLRLPMESRLGTFDAFPFDIWRSEDTRELRVAPSDRVVPSPVLGESAFFRCVISPLGQRRAPAKPVDTTSNPPPTLDLQIHGALLGVDDHTRSAATGRTPIRVDDAIVDELASDLMANPVHSYTTACMAKLLCARLGHLLGSATSKNHCGFEEWQLCALMEALDEATDDCASVAQIASRCRLSVCHFSRLFKATFGMPLHRYRVNQRMKEARSRLLDSTDPISQIALDCGFADQSSFTRRFTALSGVSPGIWRRGASGLSARRNLSHFANA
jgi:AraC-like DNA-binding protein